MALSRWKTPLLLLGSVFILQSILAAEPPKPGEIVVLKVTNSSISLEWGQPSIVDTLYEFNVTYNSSAEIKTITTETNSTMLNNLMSGTSYNVMVVTIVNNTASVPVVKNIFTAPNPVSNVKVSNHTTTSITLSWKQPFGNRSDYTYKVVLSDNLRTKVTADEVIVFMNLKPGTEYTFSVFTLVAENTSADPVNISTATVPSKPGAIIVTDVSNSSISLSLGNPANMTINQYNFNISYGIASDQIKSSTESTNFTTIQGLQSGTNYTISVTTVIPAGVKSEAVVLSQFTKPNEVQNVAVVTVTTNLIILQWMKPVDHKEGYRYMILTEGNPPPIDNYGNITVEFENATITNLTSGTSYSFSITTFVADGTRANPVKTLSYTKPVQIPEAHINVSSNGTVNTLFVSWIKPSGNVEMYFIVVEDVKNSSKIIIQSTNITSAVKFPGLRPGRVYNVSVITNSGPFNVTSGNVQGITDPNPPGPITVTNFTNSFISLKWDAPLGMDDGSYTFKITYKNGSAEMFMTVNSRSAIIPNLVSGTNYSICVATIGPGELQSECISTFQFTKPNMVSNIQIVKVDTTSVTLNWTRPIEHKDDYSYLVLAKESLKPGITQNLTVNIESATLTDLTPGINYTFTIITQVANIQADGVEISSYTQPEQIPEANIRVNNNGTVDTLFVSWNKPAGNVEMYFVVVEDVNNLEKKIESTNVTSTVTFPGLRPGRVYNVTVITNSGPFNVTSGNVQGITVPNPPGTISVLSFNTSSISLNWGAPAEMDDGCCSFNITYTNGSTTETVNAPTNATTIQNLVSGTEYTIFVATVGPGQLLSRNQSIKHFTKPNPIQNLRILIFSTSSITLEWTKPEEHKAGYKYRVVTEGSPAPTNGNGNKTTMAENVTVEGLTSGTNYSFSVTTLAEDGTPAESVVIANYTEPMKIPSENISLSNENRTDTLNVSWILPPGGVESFTVEIKDRGGDHKANTVGHSVTELVFRDLRPGRLYVVTVTTISGPHYITSDNVSEATLPTPPGSIEVTDVTNSSLQFRWDRPENMDIGEYKFIVSYQTAQPPNSKHFIQETNSSIIYDLASGTKYTITVLTTIQENLNSTIMRTSIYTKPNPVKNVRVSETNSNSINLTWDQPVGYRREYNYTVQTHGNTSSAHVVSDENLLVDGLNSGDNFTFTIITLAADGTRSNPVSLSQCTDAAAISSSSLSCKGVNRRPVLNLMWTCPSGLNTGFTLQAKQNPDVVINGISAACISNKEHQYNLSNVEFSTTYIVSITTLSCGLPSTPVSINCTSGITDPPRPLNTLELLNLDIGHKLIQFNIGRGAFNSTSGAILTVAVIVTKDENENAPNDKDLATAYSSGILTYVTQVINLPTAPQNTRVDAQTDPIRINVGDNSQTMGYLNQELTPLTGYRFSLAGFTKVQYNEEKKIDPNKSLYSTYEYSGMITTKQDPGVIIGAVVGTILGALVIVFLAVLLIWWKKRTKSNNKNLTQLPIPNMRVARNAINVDYFEGYFSKQHADSDCGFAEEYEELKTVGISQSTQVSQQPLNKPKNRYNNVLPYDNSRVKLSVTSDPSSDYINANFMPGYHSKKEFIAAQGPLMNTVSDFWRMIWDQRVPAVVMLTKCVEQGRAKCEQYWPTERPLIFEDKIVTLTSEVIYQDWTIRDFSVVKDKSGEKYHVKQFHFTGWPDHGVPSTTGILIKFRNLVRDYINQHPLSGPTVVHCSAGVGRTGTFISIDNMIQQIDNNRKVDIWGTVYQLRMNRPLMVQTESQYVFLNQCAMEYIKSSKQHTEEAIYENAPALIYENTSAIRAAQASNGHIL